MRVALVFVALLSLTACKKHPPVEDPGDLGMGSGSESGSGTGTGTAEGTGEGAPQALIDAQGGQIEVLELLADAAAGATPDCTKMATDMNAVLADGEDKLKAMDQFTDEVILEHQQELEDKFGTRIDTAMSKFGEAIEPCEDDDAIHGILQALGLV